jgi:hypothetical protein
VKCTELLLLPPQITSFHSFCGSIKKLIAAFEMVTTRKTTAETEAAIVASLQPQAVMDARPPTPSPGAPPTPPVLPPPVDEVICEFPCADINLMPPRLITTVGGPVTVSARIDTSSPSPVAEETATVVVTPPGDAPPPCLTRSPEHPRDISAAPSPLVGATIGEVALGLSTYRVMNNEQQSEMEKKSNWVFSCF